jgi:hypothetical protein
MATWPSPRSVQCPTACAFATPMQMTGPVAACRAVWLADTGGVLAVAALRRCLFVGSAVLLRPRSRPKKAAEVARHAALCNEMRAPRSAIPSNEQPHIRIAAQLTHMQAVVHASRGTRKHFVMTPLWSHCLQSVQRHISASKCLCAESFACEAWPVNVHAVPQ